MARGLGRLGKLIADQTRGRCRQGGGHCRRLSSSPFRSRRRVRQIDTRGAGGCVVRGGAWELAGRRSGPRSARGRADPHLLALLSAVVVYTIDSRARPARGADDGSADERPDGKLGDVDLFLFWGK
jgi:hypothetical protein